MHISAMHNCELFFKTYGRSFDSAAQVTVVDIGSQDVNGSLRAVVPSRFNYIGVDFVQGRGVDVVLEDPYTLPFPDASVEIIISSSCFEHSEMFWLTYLEILRVLKPNGLFYLNAPSNGLFHRYPVDCWRFYPDSGGALVTWAKRNGMNPVLLESFISNQQVEVWNDFVAIFLKDEKFFENYRDRICEVFDDFKNGFCSDSSSLINQSDYPEDLLKIRTARDILAGAIKVR